MDDKEQTYVPNLLTWRLSSRIQLFLVTKIIPGLLNEKANWSI